MRERVAAVFLCMTLIMSNVTPAFAAQSTETEAIPESFESEATYEENLQPPVSEGSETYYEIEIPENADETDYTESESTSSFADNSESEEMYRTEEDLEADDSHLTDLPESGKEGEAPLAADTESAVPELPPEEVAISPEDESAEEPVGATVGLGVEMHTQDQIRSYLKSSGVSLYSTSTYSRTPNTTSGSYDPGLLSDDTLNNSLGVVNLVRYIAGLNYDVALDGTYTELSQAATFINYLNGALSHYPERPSGVSDTLYDQACRGAGSSNMSFGFGTIGDSILYGQMADNSSSSNLDTVGHRRWLLNPDMGKVGFGQTNYYYSLYTFDRSRKGTETNVAWPAQNMPIDFFRAQYPWSISTGQNEDISRIKVNLTRMSDNRTWTFSNGNTGDGHFNVNNLGYGKSGCIIFRPDDISYKTGDVFRVTITGAKAGTIEYTVSFFDLIPVESVTLNSEKLTMESGSSVKLTATPYPKDATSTSVTWTSQNTGVCTVSNNGTVKAVSAGTTTITAEIGGKKASCTVTVTFVSINNATIRLNETNYTYTGKAIEASVGAVVLNNGSKLTKDTDYRLSFKNNKNAGTATVIATGIGKYTGSTSSTYTISPYNLANVSVSSISAQNYTGSQIRPVPTVSASGSKLTEGVDFTFSYGTNIEASTGGKVTINAKSSNFTGSKTVSFTINKAAPRLAFASSSVSKTGSDADFTNNLTKTTDGTVTFKSSDTAVATVNSTSGLVKIRGTGQTTITALAAEGRNYLSGSASYKLTVTGISIEKVSVGGVSLSYGYSGKEYTPALTVKVNGITLTEGTDYTVIYENNKNPGTATITITGKGSYSGTRIKTFEIVDCVSSLVSGKTYQLIPKNNSKTAVCSYSGKMVNNTKVYITDRSNSEAMKFKAIKNSDGTWKFINAKCELALAVQQNSSAVGAGLVLYDQTTKAAQNWKLSKKSDNSFAIINAVTGYSIAMSDESAVKGTTLNMAETASTGLQRFYIAETSAVSAPYDGTKSVRASKDKSFALNIASSSKTDGANVNLYTYTNSNAKKFKIMYSGGGYYRLVNINSGLCLTVKGNTKTDGANVIQSKWVAASGQRWKITKNSDGTVTLTNALGTILHLNGNKTANGTNVVSKNAASTKAQRWYLN